MVEYEELIKTNKRVTKKKEPMAVRRPVLDGWHKIERGKVNVYTVGNVVKEVSVATPAGGTRPAKVYKRVEDYKTGAYSYIEVENVPYIALSNGGLSRHYYEVY